MIKYFGTLNWWGLELDLLDSRREDDFLEPLLHGIGKAIESSMSRIAQIGPSSDSDDPGESQWADAVVDEECDAIEDYLGAAFLLCQPHITRVVSRIKYFHDIRGDLIATGKAKTEILAVGSRKIGDGRFTEIQVIDAFANYFKHREEAGWRRDWNGLEDRERKTAEVLQSVGAEPGSTGNFRTGIEAFGIEYNEVPALCERLCVWRRELHDRYRDELKQKGLLQE